MVTRYDAISSRWSSHFWVKMHVFSAFFRIKSKLVDKMMQSNYLCVILDVKRRKLFIFTVFTWFLFLAKIQDGGHVWWRHRPPTAPSPIKYTSSFREDQRFSTEGKIVSKYCNISNPFNHQPSTPSRTTVGVWLCPYVRGLKVKINGS